MSDGTKIEWTEATWNPITGCSVTSPGCTNCYAMKLAGTRLRNHPSRAGLTADSKAGPVWTGEVRFNEQWLDQPLRWQRPRMIFVCAHGDLFHESVPDEWIDRVMAVAALSPQHTLQILTKRSARMREYFDAQAVDWSRIDSIWREIHKLVDAGLADHPGDREIGLPLPNVWLGVSVEDQARAGERIPDLLATPAAVRWLSCEPLLGPVDLSCIDLDGDHFIEPLSECRWENLVDEWRDSDPDWREQFEDEYGRSPDDAKGLLWPRIDWIVVGGESGPGARPMHPDWARSLRDQCEAAGVPFFFKQWGSFRPTSDANGEYMMAATKKESGRLLDGSEYNAMPEMAA